MEGTETFPVTEECLSFTPQCRRGVQRLQKGQIILLYTFKNGHVLTLCADQTTPLQIQFTDRKRETTSNHFIQLFCLYFDRTRTSVPWLLLSPVPSLSRFGRAARVVA